MVEAGSVVLRSRRSRSASVLVTAIVAEDKIVAPYESSLHLVLY